MNTPPPTLTPPLKPQCIKRTPPREEMGHIYAVVGADTGRTTPPSSPKEHFTEIDKTFMIAVCDMLESHVRSRTDSWNELDAMIMNTRGCLNDTIYAFSS